MAKYVVLGRFRKETAYEQVKDRVEKANKAAASVNAKLEALYYTMGPYDYVAIMDAPDNMAMTAWLTWYAKLGVAETTTMPGFTADEMMKAAGRIK